MRCFFCKNLNDTYVELSDFDKRHLFSVLRAKPKTKILLIDGLGNSAEAIIVNDKKIRIEKLYHHKPPKIKIHLYVAPPRKQKMDLLLSQCTEAGVWFIQPILTENSVAFPKKENVAEKWKTKLTEACKQAHNPFIPQIGTCITFKKAIQNIANSNITAFFGSTDFTKPLPSHPNINNKTDYAWFVGPEGGFSEKEIKSMLDAGFYELSIGSWIMRTETAAVTGTALLQQIL